MGGTMLNAHYPATLTTTAGKHLYHQDPAATAAGIFFITLQRIEATHGHL